jgi:hypothetical protein
MDIGSAISNAEEKSLKKKKKSNNSIFARDLVTS